MGLVKLTFDGSLNTAKQDAEFNYFLTNKQNGIIKGLGSEVSTSVMGGNIVLNDGYISVYGRRTYIETGTQVAITQNEVKKGYVILKINTNTNEVTLETKEGTSSSYPGLTQENLSVNDGIYEFPIVGYIKTTSSINLDESVKIYINTNKKDLETVKDDINTRISNLQHGIIVTSKNGTKEGKMCKFKFYSDELKSDGIIFFQIKGYNVSFCTSQIKTYGNSGGFSVKYNDGSTTRTIQVTKESNIIVLQMPDDSTKVSTIYLVN